VQPILKAFPETFSCVTGISAVEVQTCTHLEARTLSLPI